jgi:hypothetical protein
LRDHALEVARYRDARDAAETPVPADEYAQAAGRTFDAELDSALDAEASEARVRAILADFNARIIEARRSRMARLFRRSRTARLFRRRRMTRLFRRR